MRTAILAAAALALSACTTTTDPDAAAQKTLGYACPAMQVAYQGAIAYQLAGGKLSAKDQATIEDAYDAATQACADPSKATASDAVALVLQETAIIARVLRKHA